MFALLVVNVYGMRYYNINTQSVNVELSQDQERRIWRQIAPLFRIIDRPDEMRCDVVIRAVEKPLYRTMHLVAVRLAVAGDHYYAVQQSMYFSRALRLACEDLRKQISRTYNPETQIIEHMRREAHDNLFAKMFQ